MRYIDEFRNQRLIKKLAKEIQALTPDKTIRIMEVCGTHTMSFFRFGIDKLLPENLKLISGPGCPVCVSTQEYIDTAITLSQQKDALILTFGDMLRVPGTKSTLEKERAKGRDVRIVYSPYESITIARGNPQKKVIFLAVGFETTAPTIALSIIAAKKKNIRNLSFFCALKLIPPVMRHLLTDERLNLDGFLCPGHVSSIIGSRAYEFIPNQYKIACCVAGFEPLDILEGIYLLLKQIVKKSPKVDNQYMRVVSKEGNPKAKRIIKEVFQAKDSFWRGLGKISESGLEIKKDFSAFDTEKVFNLTLTKLKPQPCATGCSCAEVLKGLISPKQCPLFARICSPENPYGPCMVSSEGTCSAYYKYNV
ncbi:MAG: hydrogenase formation protein HypD [Candidatus Omnitrophica bacterium]|nr:hydrogenase formation protein HypD [Candidatus Omnitrophota bacterium]